MAEIYDSMSTENSLDKIPIIIPSLHPNERLLELLENLRSMTSKMLSIILVDDGSGAAYSEIFQKAQTDFSCMVLTSKVNQGKGRALKNAFLYVLENLPDVMGVVTVDGDGQHAAEDVLACMVKLAENPGHLILGCRQFDSREIPLKSRFGNKLTKKVLCLTKGINVGDTQTGLRAIPTSYLKLLTAVPGERYEYEMNVLLACGENRIPIYEVPIKTIYLEGNRGSHFHPIFDSLKIYTIFIRYLISAVSSFLLDVAVFTLLVMFLKGSLPDHYIFIATVISRGCSSLFNYIANKTLVFKTRVKEGSAARYYVLAVSQMAASALLVTEIFSLFPRTSETMVKIFVDTILFFLSFYIQRKWVFKSK